MGFSRDSDRMEAETHSRLQSGVWTLISSDGYSLSHLGDVFKRWSLQGVSTPHPHCLAPACLLRLSVPPAPPPNAVALAVTLETASFK